MKQHRSKSLALILSMALSINIAGGPVSPAFAAAPADTIQEHLKAVLRDGPAAVEKMTPQERQALAAQIRSDLQKIETGEVEAAALKKTLALLEEPPPFRSAALEGKKYLSIFRSGSQKIEEKMSDVLTKQNEAQAAASFWDGAAEMQALRDAPISAASATTPAEKLTTPVQSQIFYVDNSLSTPVPPLIEEQNKKSGFSLKEWMANLYNRIYRPADGENTKWLYAPIKVVSFPAVKIMYDLPTLATSTVTESVTRSPLHNLLGTADTLYGMVRSAVSGVWKMVKGVLNPTKATIVDGALQLADTGFSALKTAAGVVKTAASVVGYPVYRFFGGEKSTRVPLPGKGKRAAIVLIDSALPFGFGPVIDAFGDQIVRYHFGRTADYYCAASLSNGSSGSVSDCIEKMPRDIKNVDFIALTHSGGMSDIDSLARDAVRDGKRPGIVASIGCGDPTSALTEPENTVGQKGTSWAVHFYLGGMLEKRLRGMPMRQAAMEAYREGMLINAFNPISIAAIATIGAMETSYRGPASIPEAVRNGYSGSTPRLAGQ